MTYRAIIKCVFLNFICTTCCQTSVPIVVTTWPFTDATDAAWNYIQDNPHDPVGAVVAGCTYCEMEQCDGSVGFGGKIDENGETTLDAMIMDGVTHQVGSVGALRRVKNAIGVAHAIMKYSGHTMLVGAKAKEFAVQMGFTEETLQTNATWERWEDWLNNNCQPNSRQNVVPDPSASCGPYSPVPEALNRKSYEGRYNKEISQTNHDTIGMVSVNSNGDIAAGCSTNGVSFKVPGRVGDSPITGSGGYADNDFAGCAGTGDGDVMMRFLPCFHAVEQVRQGTDVSAACQSAMQRIVEYYPNFSGAVVAVTKSGQHGASCSGLGSFPYSVRTTEMNVTTVFEAQCIS